MRNYPMHSLCGAHCRTTGEPCKNPPMPNGRCRMHGGKSTGRPQTGGMFTKSAKAMRRELAELNRQVRSLMTEMKE
jgi:hypothetical protein